MFNKPLIRNFYTADPSAHVFNGKIYIYPSHDREHDGPDNDNGDQYLMEDYRILSQETPEGTCIDHGEALHLKDVPWVSRQMWAPDAAEKDGKFYLYFPARDKEGIFRIGVAESGKPEGPFIAEPDYIQGSYSIDPCVFKDKDGSHYLYAGGLWGGQLQSWKTGEFNERSTEPKAEEAALCPKVAKLSDNMKNLAEPYQDLLILDDNGDPLKAGDEERRYFEGPWMHMYKGKYYFSYSTGTTHKIAYAIGDSPYGPFHFKGHILPPVSGWTTHHSIVEFNGQWFLYYHDCSLSGGVNHKRCVKVAPLKYNEDGTIIPVPYEN